MSPSTTKILIGLGILGGAAAIVGITYAVTKKSASAGALPTGGTATTPMQGAQPPGPGSKSGSTNAGPLYDTGANSGGIYTASGSGPCDPNDPTTWAINPKTGTRIPCTSAPPSINQETGTYA